MPRDRRPAVVLVVAILNMLFGGMNLLSLLCCVPGMVAFANVPMPGPAGNPYMNMWTYFGQRVPIVPIMIGAFLYWLIISTALFASGVGLWKMRRWARRLAIAYAVVQLVYVPIGIVIGIVWVNPLISGWAEQFTKESTPPGAPPPPTVFGGGMYNFASAFGGVIGAIYPITMLILLFLPHVRAAFAPAGATAIAEEEELPSVLDADPENSERHEEQTGLQRRGNDSE